MPNPKQERSPPVRTEDTDPHGGDEDEVVITTPVEDSPRDGIWRDAKTAPTPDEIDEGNRLGRTIDINDDEDNGLGGGPVVPGDRS